MKIIKYLVAGVILNLPLLSYAVDPTSAKGDIYLGLSDITKNVYTVIYARDGFSNQSGYQIAPRTDGAQVFRDPYFFGYAGFCPTTTLEGKVILESTGLRYGGNIIYAIPDNPNYGVIINIGDTNARTAFSYTDKEFHQVFRYGRNCSTTQGVQVSYQPVVINSVQERVTNLTPIDVISGNLLVGYVRSKSFQGNTLIGQSRDVPIYIRPQKFIQKISSCTYSAGDMTVKMPTVSKTSFKGNNSEVYAGTFLLNLNQCGLLGNDGEVTVGNMSKIAVTFTDAKDPTNRTDKLNLLDNSSARGVKLRLYKSSNTAIDTSPIKFGADSRVYNNENAHYIDYTPNAQTVSQRYIVKYVQDGNEITTGTVNATATFTFSYQ